MNSEEKYLFETDNQFEDEVRRIARLLWPTAEFDGAAIAGGRERDGIFVTEECVHIVECTTSRKRDKAEEDAKKLFNLARSLRASYPQKVVKGWFVTLNEPTADQRAPVEKHRDLLVAVSYDQLRAKLVDARTYLELRRKYPFGSVRDPDGHPIDDLKFIQLDMVDKDTGDVWPLDRILDIAVKPSRIVLLGDYGAGKSSTMRELFIRLARKFWNQETRQFPLLLNLRDHHGQVSPVEALERHARNIGYSNPSHLVRAWRSGFVTLLLDGFDEIATSGWLNQSTKLKDLRYRAMALIRAFSFDTPSDSSIVLAGRSHFFDNAQEMGVALALMNSTRLHLDEFTDQQIQLFLQSQGWSGQIPAWLPARPLLLGYLVRRNLMGSTVSENAQSPAEGWDVLLDRVCARESRIEAGIDGGTIRKIIERLATKARAQFDGLAPITSEMLIETFREVCGFQPDDMGVLLLQRLPGLGVRSLLDGSREFIDKDMVDVARAGDVLDYMDLPFNKDLADFRALQCPLGDLGVEVCALRGQRKGLSSGKVSTAVQEGLAEGCGVLAADIARVMLSMRMDYSGRSLFISNVVMPGIYLDKDSPRLDGIEFQDCMFQSLEVDHNLELTRLPTFVRCYFGEVEGRMGPQDLPAEVFKDCVFDSFVESASTTSKILDSTLEMGTKVLLTVLKKVYFQRGSGRKESALYRGLDHRARRLVPEVIDLLAREDLILKSKSHDGTLWLPVRAQSVRVQRILVAPNRTVDSLLSKSALIS
jgi:hypothetical protein